MRAQEALISYIDKVYTSMQACTRRIHYYARFNFIASSILLLHSSKVLKDFANVVPYVNREVISNQDQKWIIPLLIASLISWNTLQLVSLMTQESRLGLIGRTLFADLGIAVDDAVLYAGFLHKHNLSSSATGIRFSQFYDALLFIGLFIFPLLGQAAYACHPVKTDTITIVHLLPWAPFLVSLIIITRKVLLS